jgi:hypothetical protein
MTLEDHPVEHRQAAGNTPSTKILDALQDIAAESVALRWRR